MRNVSRWQAAPAQEAACLFSIAHPRSAFSRLYYGAAVGLRAGGRL
jgi:hypothetical protein